LETSKHALRFGLSVIDKQVSRIDGCQRRRVETAITHFHALRSSLPYGFLSALWHPMALSYLPGREAGRARKLFPTRDLGPHRIQLLPHKAKRILSEEQPHSRIVHVNQRKQCLRRLVRIARLVAALGLARGADGVHDQIIVSDAGRRPVHLFWSAGEIGDAGLGTCAHAAAAAALLGFATPEIREELRRILAVCACWERFS